MICFHGDYPDVGSASRYCRDNVRTEMFLQSDTYRGEICEKTSQVLGQVRADGVIVGKKCNVTGQSLRKRHQVDMHLIKLGDAPSCVLDHDVTGLCQRNTSRMSDKQRCTDSLLQPFESQACR